MKVHGSGDLKRLAEAVPSKTEDSIKNYIKNFKKWQITDPHALLRSDALSDLDQGSCSALVPGPRKEPEVPIECWIKMMEGDIQYNALKKEEIDANLSSVVPSVLEFIAQNEDHPKMDESNKVDYAAIYEALAQVNTWISFKPSRRYHYVHYVALSRRGTEAAERRVERQASLHDQSPEETPLGGRGRRHEGGQGEAVSVQADRHVRLGGAGGLGREDVHAGHQPIQAAHEVLPSWRGRGKLRE